MSEGFATNNIFYACGYESGYELGYQSGRKEEQMAVIESAKKLGPEIYAAVLKSIEYSANET